MKGSKVRILEYLKKNGSITSMEAFQLFGITRLSARIKELRELGYDIVTLYIEHPNRYGEMTRYGKYWFRDNNHKGEAIDGNN